MNLTEELAKAMYEAIHPWGGTTAEWPPTHPDDSAYWRHLAAVARQHHDPLHDFQWEPCGDNRHGQPTGRWIGPIHVDHNQETPE